MDSGVDEWWCCWPYLELVVLAVVVVVVIEDKSRTFLVEYKQCHMISDFELT
jgi:hypothetical protein